MDQPTASPPKNSRRNIIALVIVVLIVAVVAFLIRDYVRFYVAPFVLYVLWITQLLISSLPQALLWAVFLIVAFVLAWRSLLQTRHRTVRKERPANVYFGRVEELARMIEQAGSGDYFARRLERQVSDLTFETLGHGDKLTPPQAQQAVEKERGRIPSLIHEFLQRTTAQRTSGVDMMTQYNNRFTAAADRVLRQARSQPAVSPDVDAVIAYMEQQLEVKGD